MRMYKRIKMFVHAEAEEKDGLIARDLSCFLRLGTDFTANYYEYEVFLTPTDWDDSRQDEIWPSQNEIDIELEILQQAKQDCR